MEMTSPSPDPVRLAMAWPEFVIDSLQRSILFLDVLRQRGNEEIAITSQPAATVLTFDHELVLDGRDLPRPINYSLYRIRPPAEFQIDDTKRPIVIVDPRAGQSAGIGGFKRESEIGDALRAGHPTYFVGFSATPVPNQGFLDVVEGEARFFERVSELHPDAPKLTVIGNCQAGYQVLMSEMLNPTLYGPSLVVGAPMSYWQGRTSTMRYTGGLTGGSWIAEMLSDLGNGRFDGAWLILNFDLLNPSNFLWGKQYDVYADVDTGADRYLTFEKWWGDFVGMNGDEILYLVDNLFIGNKLTRNELWARDGTNFDLRNLKSPIVVLTSAGDNISPPSQTLGWILDLYSDVEEIKAAGRTIVYAVDPKAGHLGLFVSTKVATSEDEEFVLAIDAIERLEPGLYEMVVWSKPSDGTSPRDAERDWIVNFKPRILEDIQAFGRNSQEDDRAFSAVAHLSQLNLAAYRTFLQPAVRSLVNEPLAEFLRQIHPLRLSYTIFADINPWMSGIAMLAPLVKQSRIAVSAGNPFSAMQTVISDSIATSLDSYRSVHNAMVEAWFFGFYGSSGVQAQFGSSCEPHADNGTVRR